MNAVRFFTDEDVYANVAPALRRAGFDAISTPESGRLGESDEAQLDWATREGRVIVTFNVAHFATLHSEWLNRSRSHAGMIVSSQRPIGDLIRRLLNLAAAVDADRMRNRIEFLADWQ